jgi:hypothetical protein
MCAGRSQARTVVGGVNDRNCGRAELDGHPGYDGFLLDTGHLVGVGSAGDRNTLSFQKKDGV